MDDARSRPTQAGSRPTDEPAGHWLIVRWVVGTVLVLWTWMVTGHLVGLAAATGLCGLLVAGIAIGRFARRLSPERLPRLALVVVPVALLLLLCN